MNSIQRVDQGRFEGRLDFEAIEAALAAAIDGASRDACPPRLAEALRHAVFPGGARLRPKLVAAVAAALGPVLHPAAIHGAAAALEMMHCASLVHDDLPCFDDAPTRRGLPSVQHAFGEALAVLAGDGLIVLAFETLAASCAVLPDRIAPLLRVLAESAGPRRGLVAGQAWELEPRASLVTYHRAKTASLFEAATVIGATIACAPNVERWAAFGRALGEAYQAADDVADACGDAAELGKPVARDVALARPSTVRELGLARARSVAARRFEVALEAIPPCPSASELRAWTIAEVARTKVAAASRA